MEDNKHVQKKHIITIAGKPGSGKSTASKAVAAELGFQHFSSGDLFRAIGKERGTNVTQTNLAAEKNADVDYLVDQRLRDIGSGEDQVVIDSRMAWHWMPYSFKVYLDLDLEVAARRILQNIEPARMESEHIPKEPAEYAAALQTRLDSEGRRYKALYDVDPYDHSNYDLVIDTSASGPEEVLAEILNKYKAWLNG
jgi:cytidylate kinase